MTDDTNLPIKCNLAEQERLHFGDNSVSLYRSWRCDICNDTHRKVNLGMVVVVGVVVWAIVKLMIWI